MILVDTSVWVEHFRRRDDRLVALIEAGAVLIHPFVIGELALGDLHPRDFTLRMLLRVPQADAARPEEILHLIDQHRLFGFGIGYVDVHLLAAARLTSETALWTHDTRLRAAAEKLGCAHHPTH